MNQTKPWWQSTTLAGALAALIGLALKAFGIEVAGEEVTGLATYGLMLVGIIATIIGRFRATKKLAAKKTPS